MNTTGNESHSSDERLDAMLRRSPVSASKDFTTATLARIRQQPEVSDAMLDDLLTAMPAQPHSGFTTATVRLARSSSDVMIYLRPILSAAASVAICLTGIWAMDTADTQSGKAQQPIASAAPAPGMDDLVALAGPLKDAAPLLDKSTRDTLAFLANRQE